MRKGSKLATLNPVCVHDSMPLLLYEVIVCPGSITHPFGPWGEGFVPLSGALDRDGSSQQLLRTSPSRKSGGEGRLSGPLCLLDHLLVDNHRQIDLDSSCDTRVR